VQIGRGGGRRAHGVDDDHAPGASPSQCRAGGAPRLTGWLHTRIVAASRAVRGSKPSVESRRGSRARRGRPCCRSCRDPLRRTEAVEEALGEVVAEQRERCRVVGVEHALAGIARRRSEISASASSQLTATKVPAAFGPFRRSGTVSAPAGRGSRRCTRIAHLRHSRPRLTGCARSPPHIGGCARTRTATSNYRQRVVAFARAGVRISSSTNARSATSQCALCATASLTLLPSRR